MLNIHPRSVKIFFYILLMSTTFVLQSAFAYQIELFGVKIDMLSAVFVSIAIFDDIWIAISFGAFTGYLYELNFSQIEGLHLLYFVFAAIIIYFLSENQFNKSFLTNSLFVFIFVGLNKVVSYFIYFLISSENDYITFFIISSKELLVTLILCPITYFITKKIYKKFTKLGD